MKLFVTGGAGFIGSNFIHHLLSSDSDWELTNYDALTYAGNLENLAQLKDDPRYRFVKGDVSNPQELTNALDDSFDAIVHFAAESHVDRSIEGARIFLETNVLGTQVLLERARELGGMRFVMVSTDEVYGSLGPQEEAFSENTPLAPNSPYSASKASADLLCRAYHHTFGLPVIVTRCSNNYGPYQFPEKLIPLMISNALQEEPLPVYGDGKNVRDWLYVRDHCSAIEAVLKEGRPGEIYNIGGDSQRENIQVVRLLLEILGKPESLIRYVGDRPGHDRRYAIDASKITRELGWRPQMGFEEGLAETVQWYLEHGEWLEQVRSGEYRAYYQRMYSGR
ncbi:MAG TPA: dTDP-glucose 4,6-dehydratase [Candidatus Krumholzibacteria bacterium]|nr:dTDP-glucose 4,6-dehydratase [Candidatus Krumholzibacteria bacterium]